MKKSLIIAGALAVALIAGIAVKEMGQEAGGAGMAMGRGARLVPVEVASVERRDLEVRVEAVGTAYAQESVEITPNVSETVESIHFEDGAQVSKGDVLVVLTSNEEQAELKVAQANFAEQEREVNRLRNLVKSNTVSQNQLDERLTLRETALQRVEVAEARLRDRTIRAPFTGVLGLRQVSPGAMVSPGRVITTLDDTAVMKLDFSVPSIYLGALQQNMPVSARSPAYANRVFTGKVVTVDSRVNPIDRSIKVRAELPNKDGAIKHGVFMQVQLTLSNRETLTIPESALVPQRDEQFVFVVEGEEQPRARLQKVEIGTRQPGLVEIIQGLKVGQQVVTKGSNTIDNGSQLQVVNAPG